ncbi:MAG: SPOR domain-containing protein [Candidatus Accumulibacter sp.]|nr:SPOR domain-containing protein [Accumulibacter sp.]MCP5228120.1 SPOR domain-containing protein [Accumulibacter sp.]
MSRDMKPPRKTPARKKSGGGTLLGLFIGLVIGVIAVAGVVWYVNRVPLPFTTTGQQPKLPPPVADAPPPAPPPDMAALPPAPVALPGKPGDSTAPEKPRFDFYKILPGNAEAIPDPTQRAPGLADIPPAVEQPLESKALDGKPPEVKTVDTSKPEREATLKQPIYLQAGSFQNVGEADNQKARLALMGVEARIQQVMLHDKVWYRVRLGPYPRMDEVNILRSELARQGIDARVVKKD